MFTVASNGGFSFYPLTDELRAALFQREFEEGRKWAKQNKALLDLYAIVYFGSARCIELDRTGRLPLPPELRARLGLTERVVFVGIDEESFQLWRPESQGLE